jgi:hypothetical protein
MTEKLATKPVGMKTQKLSCEELGKEISRERDLLEKNINQLITDFENKYTGGVMVIPITQIMDKYDKEKGGRIQLWSMNNYCQIESFERYLPDSSFTTRYP